MNAWTEKEVVAFAKSSAREAIDQQAAFASIDDAVTSYQCNMLGTLNENGAQHLHNIADEAFYSVINAAKVAA